MAQRVLQFGTSRFLQAHADLFIHEAREAGQDIGPITVVKTTLAGARDGRVSAFGAPAGFPVKIRGFQNGEVVDDVVQVQSVVRALDANRQWPALNHAFSNETELVISNTGDAGYVIDSEEETSRPIAGQAPRSFPAKLLSLLIERHRRTAAPIVILPCELIVDNGRILRGLLSDLADRWGGDDAFKQWLSSEVTICDTLVDRIVSEAIEPVGAIAEPYALWAIKREPGLRGPFQHPDVVYTDSLEPFVRLKLHILNLGHTYIAEIWRREGRAETETVREFMGEASVRTRLLSLYDDEVLPGFAARGMAEEAGKYVVVALERFDNPFLDHRISDIFGNHPMKIKRRIDDFITWVRECDPNVALPRLEALGATAMAEPVRAGN